MKKILTFMLWAALTATTYGQQPNVRLTQLEQYLPTQYINVNKRQANSAGRITYRMVASTTQVDGNPISRRD